VTPRLNRRYAPVLATAAVFLLLYVVAALRYENFASLLVLVNFFRDNCFLGIAAVGMTFVILSDGIDLSPGAVIAFAGVITAQLVERAGWPPLAAIGLVLACGTALGTVHGLVIHYLEAPAFIVTLGGMFLARGIAQLVSLESIPISHPFFERFVSLGIPLPDDQVFPAIACLFMLVLAVGWFVAQQTRFGRYVYAVGGGRAAALLMGVPVARVRVAVYAISGFCSALAGIVFTMYTSAGWGLNGVGFELDTIAAVVIGGTLITGGVGFMAGTLIGVLIMAIIQQAILFQGDLNSWWTRIAIAFLLLVFVLLQRVLGAIPGGAVEPRRGAGRPPAAPVQG
jgi:simple sugar transport system permease protein